MPIAVMCMSKSTVHFSSTNDCNTVCKNWATEKAGPIVFRGQFCKLCFGKDQGLSCWTAEKLGLERIIENE